MTDFERGAEDARWAVGQLRHLYEMLLKGLIRDQAEAARGLLGPAIARLEPLTTAYTRPPGSESREAARLAVVEPLLSAIAFEHKDEREKYHAETVRLNGGKDHQGPPPPCPCRICVAVRARPPSPEKQRGDKT